MNSINCFAIIVAGGKGLRMGLAQKKQYIRINGVPVLSRTLAAFDQVDLISKIVLVVPSDDIDICRKTIVEPWPVKLPVLIVEGGSDRQASVYNGLKTLKDEFGCQKNDLALIHDGVRPFVTRDLIKTCLDGASRYGAAIPCCEIVETVKRVTQGKGQDKMVTRTVDRDALYTAQTPQTFCFDTIWNVHTSALKKNIKGTDDASLVEIFGGRVLAVPGLKSNIKITRPEDLLLAEYLVANSPAG